MNEFVANKAAPLTNHFDIVRKIEAMSGEIPYAIKRFKEQVSAFLSMDKRLVSLKLKTEKRASSKKLDRLDSYISEYQSAYRKCRESYTSVSKALDEIDVLYTRLADFYNSEGRRKEAKRVVADGEKFDKVSRKQLDAISLRLNSANEISTAKKAEEDIPPREERNDRKPNVDYTYAEREQREQRTPRDNGAPRRYGNYPHGAPNTPPPYNANPYNYPPYDYRMPPMYYQPMPSFNIAPISIDVNAAVDSAIESFAKAFEERIGEYLDGYELPEVQHQGVSEEESRAFDKVIEDGGFALEKLSALLEKVGNMLSTLSELTAKYSELEEKTHTLSESMKSANDTQRTLARDLQGIQATQKVISGDQLKLAEEQIVVVEEQKAAIERQAELKDRQSATSNEIKELLDGTNQTIDGLKESLERQNGIATALGEVITAGDKLLELQKNLEARQTELTEMQRDALLAQKKLARSQKAVNERSGAKTNARKEKSEVEKTTPPEEEALEIPEKNEALEIPLDAASEEKAEEPAVN